MIVGLPDALGDVTSALDAPATLPHAVGRRPAEALFAHLTGFMSRVGWATSDGPRELTASDGARAGRRPGVAQVRPPSVEVVTTPPQVLGEGPTL